MRLKYGAIAIITLLAACQSAATPAEPALLQKLGASSVPSGQPSIQGTLAIVQDGDSLPSSGAPNRGGAPPTSTPRSITVEGTGGSLGQAKLTAIVPAGAAVLERTSNGVVALSFTALRVGMKVELWLADGVPMTMQYPMVGQAKTIVVTGR